MAEQATPVSTQSVPSGPKKKKRRGRVKTILSLVLTAAVIASTAGGLWYFVFRQTDTKGEILTDTAEIGSISAKVEGNGLTRARQSATVAPVSGTVLEVLVKEGDTVTKDQLLYRMDDAKAREGVAEAQKAVDNCLKEIQTLQETAQKKLADLTVKAPHAGNLREVAAWKAGDTVSAGDAIATIVNDTKLRLSLYYSYAYEASIQVGQTAQISIPAIMGERTGKVEQINRVRFVSPEGAAHFEVVFVLDNPGTLTEGMEASAAITGKDGAPIYPYQNGKLAFYETTAVKVKEGGTVEQFQLLNYADIKAGQVLLQVKAQDNREEMTAKEEALKAAQEKLNQASEELAKFNGLSPIDGTVLSCSLTAGQEVESGQGISIADTSQMTVDINVDERNARFLQKGMEVELDQYGTPYVGTVESVSMTAKGENGVATVPAVLKVDNPDGSMIPGTYVNYSFIASQSDHCLTVAASAVQNVSFANVTLPDNLDAPALPEEPWTPEESGMPEERPVEEGILPEEPIPEEESGMAAPLSFRSGKVTARPLSSLETPVSLGGEADHEAEARPAEGTIVFVQAEAAPANAILEPDPAWECPEGFWAVPVEIGLSDASRVEIKRGLNVGDIVFIGYATQSADSWGEG